jgi:hypothetical protein
MSGEAYMEEQETLIDCIKELTREVRLLRNDLRPELEKSLSLDQRRKKEAKVSLAAGQFLSNFTHHVKCNSQKVNPNQLEVYGTK